MYISKILKILKILKTLFIWGFAFIGFAAVIKWLIVNDNKINQYQVNLKKILSLQTNESIDATYLLNDSWSKVCIIDSYSYVREGLRRYGIEGANEIVIQNGEEFVPEGSQGIVFINDGHARSFVINSGEIYVNDLGCHDRLAEIKVAKNPVKFKYVIKFGTYAEGISR